MIYRKTNLFEAIQTNTVTDNIKNNLANLFVKYENYVMKYKIVVQDSFSDLEDDTIADEIDKNLSIKEEMSSYLKNIISVLNQIQTIFYKLGYRDTTGAPNDVSETNFIVQLDQFNKQAYRLIENFKIDTFRAFANIVFYLTSLAEIHYNTQFGPLEENIIVSEKLENEIEETKDYIDSLPEVKTNEIK